MKRPGETVSPAGTSRRPFAETIDYFLASNGIPMLVAWPALGIVVLLSLFILYMTFVPNLPFEPGYTLEHWTSVLTSSYIRDKVLPNTIIVGFGTVLVALAFAAPLAWLLNRTTMPFKGLFIGLMSVTVIVPGFVKAMGWIVLLQGQIGIINRLLMDAFGLPGPPFNISTPWGMAWVLGLMLVPTLFFLMAGPMRALDPSLEEAARVSGANGWGIALKVSLPLVWPATLGGMIYIFMTALSIFDVPAMLGGAGGQAPVLATELFYSVQPYSAQGTPHYGAAGVYGVLIAVPSLVGLYFYLKAIGQSHRYVVISGKGYRPKDIDLGPFTWLAVAFTVFYLVLAALLPMLVLVWSSLLPRLQMPSPQALALVSLDNYEDILALVGGGAVIWNTVIVVVGTAVLVMLISFMNSWVVVRTKSRFRKVMDTIAMLPHAIPGVGFSYALLITGIIASVWVPWLPLAGTLGILVLANSLNRLAYGTRITNAALLQVGPELEESAHICGARSVGTMWNVIVPLVKPSLEFGAIWTALLTFREVSMALMLVGTDSQLVTTRIWILWRQGNTVEAAAASVCMIAVMALLLVLTHLLTGGGVIRQRMRGGSLASG
jgi:iron(III) transport system permease protein